MTVGAETMNLFAALGGLAGVFVTGIISKPINSLDRKIQNAIKPAKPVIAGVLGIALPMITNAIGITSIPPEALMTAPLGTIVGISMREVLSKIKGH